MTGGGDAGARLAGLVVAVPSPAGYDRADWPHWIDVDGDCQDTRTEVLIAESDGPLVLSPDGCSVVAGVWDDIYTGATFSDPSALDVDHLVPLAEANASGGMSWSSSMRRRYANDLGNAAALVAVSSSANRSKGARGPHEWLPPDPGAWCWYAESWISVKAQWRLTVTSAEKAQLGHLLQRC